MDNLTLYQDYDSPLEAWQDIVVAVYLIITDVMAVVLNVLVLIVARKMRKKLVIGDFYIINLAISDIGHPLLGYPMVIIALFSHRWIFGDTGCDINGFLGFQFGVASMTTLAVMSLIRYMSVCKPSTVKSMTRMNVLLSLVLIHLYALFWAVSPLFGWGRYGPEPYRTSCTLDWEDPSKSFVIATFVMCLGLPFLTMLTTYGLLIQLSRNTSKNMQRWTSSANVWTRKDFYLLKMTMIMCSCFLLAWLPYAIVSMLKVIIPDLTMPVLVTLIPALCAKSSHVLNPVIYFVMNKKLRSKIPVCCTFPRQKKNVETRCQLTATSANELTVNVSSCAKENQATCSSG